MAGYSGTPLVKKLGIKDGDLVVLSGALAQVPAVLRELADGDRTVRPCQVLIAPVERAADLAAGIPAWAEAIRPAGSLWVCWPKKAARRQERFAHVDVVEDHVREFGLPLGLVDNKVCAVDDDWSGLRLVWRQELRGH